MKTLFRLFNALHVAIYRLSKGRLGGDMRGFKILLLTTIGRHTGQAHTVPLGAFDFPGGWLVVASNAGLPANPAWYLNLQSEPQVSVQVMDRVMASTAETLAGNVRARAWQQVISSAAGYAAYERRTSREIPLVLLHPAR